MIHEEDLNVNLLDMPPKVKARTVPNEDGTLSIFINSRLSTDGQKQAFSREIDHIERGDLDYDNPKDVQQIEAEAHGLIQPAPTLTPQPRKKRKRRSRWASVNRKTKFMQSIGYDFFAAAEERHLDPDRR